MDDLQDLYNRFDGSGSDSSNARLAWYGQCRAKNMTHEEAVYDTYVYFKHWCDEVWPLRGIKLP